MGSKFGFDKKAEAWRGLTLTAMTEIAVNAKKTFDTAFANEGLEGERKWDEVQRRIPGTLAHGLADSMEHKNPILTGKSRRLQGANDIASIQPARVEIKNDTEYAQVQNEGGMVGGGITGIPHSIAARPFMMQTKKMTADQLRILRRVTGRVWSVK